MTAFLRMGDTILLPVSPSGQVVAISPPAIANSIRIQNPNAYDVRVRDSSGAGDIITSSSGLRILAGSTEVFSLQNPVAQYITSISVNSAITGTVAGSGFVELVFGTGE